MTNLLQNIEIDEEKYKNLLLSGNLYKFEEELHKFVMTEIYDKLAKKLIVNVIESPPFQTKMKALASAQRLGKLQDREVSLQLRTGTYIKVKTAYARVVPDGHLSSRYLSFQHFGVISHASPSYYSQVSKFSVLCGSFEIVKDVLDGLQIGNNLQRIRSLSLAVSKKCLQKRVESMLDSGDTLAGKRVIISTDGGRIRTREYTGEKNADGTASKLKHLGENLNYLLLVLLTKMVKWNKKSYPYMMRHSQKNPYLTYLGSTLKH
jgi:hypothetical protein